jgi:hypothetical protein
MRPLRYSITVTLDGCCDHREMFTDEDSHRHAAENLDQADALLFGRVTYEMMDAAFRPPARTGARPDWMEAFARMIDAAKKHVVSNTLNRVARRTGYGHETTGYEVPNLADTLVKAKATGVLAQPDCGLAKVQSAGSPFILNCGGTRLISAVGKIAKIATAGDRITSPQNPS